MTGDARLRHGLSVVLLALASGPLPATAQRTTDLYPGDPLLARAGLQPHEAIFHLYDLQDNGTAAPVGYWRSHVQEARADGRDLWRHTWTLYFNQATVYDQTHFDAQTFAPVMRVILSPQGHDIVDFTSADSIHFTNVPLGGGASQASSLPRDRARFSGGVDFALQNIPMQSGDVYRLHSVATDPPDPGANLVHVARVIGRDLAETETGQPIEAWRIDQHWETVDGEPVADIPASTVWLSDEPPYVVRRQFGSRVWVLAKVATTTRPVPD